MDEELYACPHCGTPTKGKVIGMIGKKVVKEMCQGCRDYIGSPAAQQEGATMNNRIEMERKYAESSCEDCSAKTVIPARRGPDLMGCRAKKRITELEAENKQLLELTENLDEHPEGYDGPCLCKLCKSYG